MYGRTYRQSIITPTRVIVQQSFVCKEIETSEASAIGKCRGKTKDNRENIYSIKSSNLTFNAADIPLYHALYSPFHPP
ncbi:hypothetical protein EYC84_001023 [Monilinia fructicola]|uniref:Uncharacterized protein n=1 Tax=Monilinia fructicola TaxID=38448 RepID=A0A5M9JNP0_MONFR|nr:hypothetical protein EYC84_001023 [Monilinia fructicola]